MTLGQKIKKLRSDKKLTQKELADQLHVSFQTVSKWESDLNEPDLSTIRQIAKLFDCSLEYLINEEENQLTIKKTEKPITEIEEVPVIKETIVIHQNEEHVCARCGKDIPEAELVSEDVTKKERQGRHTRTVSIGQTYYHKNCLEEVKKERVETSRKAKIARAASSKKKCFGWGVAAGVTALGIALAVFLCNTQYIHPALGVLYSILIGYGIFAMIYCILSGSYIGDVFVWCAGLPIKFPCLIFSWSIEGFAWLIAMKILFAIFAFLIGVAALILAIVLSSVLGAVSFPFVLIHNIRTDYENSF